MRNPMSRALHASLISILFLAGCSTSGTLSNNSPTITGLQASVTQGSAPLPVTFTVSASDPDEDTLSYLWDIEGQQYSGGSSYAYTFTAPGEHTVGVTVSDGEYMVLEVVRVTVDAAPGDEPPPSAPPEGPGEPSPNPPPGEQPQPPPSDPVDPEPPTEPAPPEEPAPPAPPLKPEQIDVLWLKGRSISRAFEVEHTTAVYSGILRMADLLALQPNMAIKLHIVAPEERKTKVFSEIRRPVFSLLDRGPLYEYCTFISYHSLQEVARLKHLNHLSDDVLEEYSEEAE